MAHVPGPARRRRDRRRVGLALAGALLASCGSGSGTHADAPPAPIGPSARFRPPARDAVVRAGADLGGLRCTPSRAARVGVHVELFADGDVVVVPAGIGLGGRTRRDGAYVRGGRCSYPIRTHEPTGLLEVDPHQRLHVRDLAVIWRRPIDRTALAGFRGRVRAWIDGEPWRGDPGDVPLRRHANVVVVLGRPVAVHARYVFPPGF